MRRRQRGAAAHTLSRGQSCIQLRVLVKSSRLLPFVFQLAPENTQEPFSERHRQILAVRSQNGAVGLCLARADWLGAITSPQRIFPLRPEGKLPSPLGWCVRAGLVSMTAVRAQISPLCWWWVFVLTLLTKCPVGVSFCCRPQLAFELQQL